MPGAPSWRVNLFEWVVDDGNAVRIGPTLGIYADQTAAMRAAIKACNNAGIDYNAMRILARPYTIPYGGCANPGSMFVGNNYAG